MNRDLKIMAIRYLDGSLTEPQVQEFEKRLKDEEGVHDFVRLARREAMLTELLRFPGTERQVAALIETRRPRSLRLVVQGLALAASIAIITGTSVIISRTAGKTAEDLAFNRADHTPDITKKSGVLTIEGHRVATGPESYCLLTYPDRTRVALDKNSAAAFLLAPSPDEKRIAHQAGRLYVEATPQRKPILVDAGPMSVQILGTRLLLGSGPDAFAEVLDGQIQVSLGTASALVHAGQRIRPVQSFAKPWLALQTQAWPPADLNWLRHIGMSIPRSSQPKTRQAPGRGDASLLIGAGTWDISRRESGITAFQRESTGQATLLLGNPVYPRGVFAFSFRALNPEKAPAITPVFFANQEPPTTMAMEPWISKLHQQGYTNWFDVTLQFDVTDKGELFVPQMTIMPREHQEAAISVLNQDLRTQRPLAEFEAVGVGVRTQDSAVEVALPDTALQGVESGVVKESRTTKGLLAELYGAAGHGLSAVKETFVDAGFNIQPTVSKQTPGNTQADYDLIIKDPRQRIKKAWKRQGGLTFEVWLGYNGPKLNMTNLYTFVSYRSPLGKFHQNCKNELDLAAKRPVQFVCVLQRDKDRNMVNFYVDGGFTASQEWPWLNRFINKESFEIIAFPSVPHAGFEIVPPATDLLYYGLYGRALTPEEIRHNYLSNVPVASDPETLFSAEP